MEYLHLEVSNSIIDGKSRRITRLRWDGTVKPIEIFYEFDRIIPWSENTVLDGHVFAILLYAASQGKPLKVHGTVSHSALRNIEELQLAWCRWKPDSYKKIEIIPDRVEHTRKIRTEEKAISAFSGGVDATFTALRHTKILPDLLRYPLRSVLMVHGFDVEIYNKEDFEQLTRRVRPTLDFLGLELRAIRTNSREINLQNWKDSHGLELAACLHMCSDEFEFGLIGSSYSYDTLELPWGSNSATDHLISGNNFSIVHDGAGFSRTDKVVVIKGFPIACKTLKVCWAGADQSGNCGKCEKCVRTQLNFLAAGVTTTPPCFPKELNIEHINDINIHTISCCQFAELVDIAAHAKKHNTGGEWTPVLEARIALRRPEDANYSAKQDGGLIKRTFIKLFSTLGLSEPAKKIWRSARRELLKFQNK